MLFPWEKFLPPWLLGPILVAIGIYALVFDARRLAWWDWMLLPGVIAFGAWGTWAWFAKGENVFRTSKRTVQIDDRDDH